MMYLFWFLYFLISFGMVVYVMNHKNECFAGDNLDFVNKYKISSALLLFSISPVLLLIAITAWLTEEVKGK